MNYSEFERRILDVANQRESAFHTINELLDQREKKEIYILGANHTAQHITTLGLLWCAFRLTARQLEEGGFQQL